MTSQSLARIEKSFELLSTRIDQMTRAFYDALFRTRPDTRALFQVNMDVQRQHLGAALALIARNLRFLDIMTEPLRELGAGHAHVGVKPEHYPVVRDAMLEAIGGAVGDQWTPQLRADWHELLEMICRVMLEGASRAAKK
jgi:hemoglobin-like flavoprotein